MRLQYSAEQNTLRLTLDAERGEVVKVTELDGVVDIAEQGRLVGLELTTDRISHRVALTPWLEDPVAGRYVEIDESRIYVALSAPEEDLGTAHVRSAEVRLRAELDAHGSLVAISIPRRGHGYEISFPSGNR